MLPTAANSPPCVLSAFGFYAVRPTDASATPARVVFGHLDDHDAQPAISEASEKHRPHRPR
jgi:hypothetical protein